MRLLLDTHIALWAITGDAKLSQAAFDLIRSDKHTTFISAASIWEIAIKYGRNRGRANDMPVSGEEAVKLFETSGYVLLPVTPDHAAAVGLLPDLHRDPFDRLLVAQALHETLRLITHDSIVKTYSGSIMLV